MIALACILLTLAIVVAIVAAPAGGAVLLAGLLGLGSLAAFHKAGVLS